MADEAKTRDERIQELLDKSAHEAVSSIKGPSLGDLATDVPKEAEQVEVPEAEDEETESGGKKVRIPRSRLQTLTGELKELREKTKAWEESQARIAALEAQIKANSSQEEELPDWWKQAYGDNEVSRQGYANQQRIMREEFQRNLEAMERQRAAEEAARAEQVEAIEQSFDQQMDALEESLGRELTATQKAELMDIVGEYSPMDGDSYVAYIPIDKAYDIWQKGQGVSQSKQEMARIASIPSGSGTSTASPERPQWGDWRKRFGN